MQWNTSAGVCVFWLAVSRTRAAQPQQHLLEAVSSLHYSEFKVIMSIWDANQGCSERQKRLTAWNFWCLLEFSSSKILLFSCTSKQSYYTNCCHFGVVFFYLAQSSIVPLAAITLDTCREQQASDSIIAGESFWRMRVVEKPTHF